MRKAISTRTRFEIFKRDNFTCAYCGKDPQCTILHIDHITPVSAGGDNSRENLITSCAECNLGKSNIPLSLIPKSLAEHAQEVKEREKQIMAFRKIFKEKKERIERECWDIVRIFKAENRHGLEVSKAYFSTIKKFIEKIGYTEVEEAMEISVDKLGKNRHAAFKYFCGICWNKYKTIQGDM